MFLRKTNHFFLSEQYIVGKCYQSYVGEKSAKHGNITYGGGGGLGGERVESIFFICGHQVNSRNRYSILEKAGHTDSTASLYEHERRYQANQKFSSDVHPGREFQFLQDTTKITFVRVRRSEPNNIAFASCYS